jgi:hypothetical protein
MQLKPGCGCLFIVLALVNAVLILASILAAVRHNLTPLGGMGMALLFAGNTTAS